MLFGMPRKALFTQKSTPKRQKWNEEDMKRAIQDVKSEKCGFKKAAKTYSVPPTTLKRLYRLNSSKSDNEPVELSKLGRKPILDPAVEKDLVDYILLMEAKLFGLTPRDIKRTAYQLAIKHGVKHQFKSQTAGRGWFDLFMRRHSSKLSIRQPTGTSKARAMGFNKEAVGNFFDVLEKEYEKHRYPASRIYNVDEKGFCIVPSKSPKILARKGKRQIGLLTAAERGSLITTVLCYNANGDYVPPMFVFPRKNENKIFMKGAPSGSIASYHSSGWIQADSFFKWFNHFISFTQPSAANPVLLILDGHYSHTRNAELIFQARESHVNIVSIPPHTSHKLQPLDKTFMSVIKDKYSKIITAFTRKEERVASLYDVAELFGNAYTECRKAEYGIKGFSSTGIFPFNRNIFEDHEFTASEVQIEGEERCEPPAPTIQPEISRRIEDVPSTSTGITHARHEPSAPIVHPRISHCSDGPSTSTGITHDGSPPLLRVPVLRHKPSTRGRKATQACLITGSPHLNSLLKSSAKKPTTSTTKTVKPKTTKRKTTKSKTNLSKAAKKKTSSAARKLSFGSDSSDPDDPAAIMVNSDNDMDPEPEFGQPVPQEDDDNVECFICNEPYTNSRPGESWIQCTQCKNWAHTECTSAETDFYICEYCNE